MAGMLDGDGGKELLYRWRTGDQAAADALYRRYAQQLCALAEKNIGERLGRRVGPEDIVQSVFRSFFRRSRDGEFQIDHSNSIWRLLVRLTWHRIKRQAERHTQGKRDVRAEVHRAANDPLPEAMAQDPTPAESAALNDELEAALVGLDTSAPEIVSLCIQGFSTSEIAAKLGCSRWKIRRLLDRVGHRLENRLRDDADH